MKRRFYFFASSLLMLAGVTMPGSAHNIKTSEDVGVTFHIEPDHNPRVGESNQAWFALTRKGGDLIPLGECLCQLQVYLTTNSQRSATPTLSPELIPISPEQYQNIPGANIVFPQPGIYELELTGSSAIAGDFAPFTVSYPVTVKPRVAAVKTPVLEETAPSPVVEQELETSQETQTSSESETKSPSPWFLATLGGGTVILLLWLKVRHKEG